MNPEEFEKLLKSHDWYYQRSDDPAAYRKGAASADAIARALAADPSLQGIHDRYNPNRKGEP